MNDYETISLRALYSANDNNNLYDKPAINPQSIGYGVTGANFRTTVAGYAMYGDDCIAVNLIGTRTSLFATIGSFHSNRVSHAITLNIGTYRTLKLATKADRYKVYNQALSNWNSTNTVILSTRLTEADVSSASSFVMANNLDQLINNVSARLTDLLPIPTMEWWKNYIFHKGRDENLISPLSGEGFNIYRINTDAGKWTDVISNGLKNNELAWTEDEHNELMSEIGL